MPTDDIAKQERISKRTIYKYLNLVYLSPKIVNQLLNGTLTVNLQKLFEMVSKTVASKSRKKLSPINNNSRFIYFSKTLQKHQIYFLSTFIEYLPP